MSGDHSHARPREGCSQNHLSTKVTQRGDVQRDTATGDASKGERERERGGGFVSASEAGYRYRRTVDMNMWPGPLIIICSPTRGAAAPEQMDHSADKAGLH